MLGMAAQMSAEERPHQQSAHIFDGAVALDWNEVTGTALLCRNPETMTNVPFQSVLDKIEQLTELQVQVRWSSLASANLKVAPETVIPEWPAGESVRQILRRIPNPQQVELTWIVQDNILSLVTLEDANLLPETKRYFVGDLVSKGCDSRQLINIVVEETTGPWDVDEPGTGVISAMGNYLVVRQTPFQQLEVEGILRALRRSEPVVLIGHSQEDLRLRRLLEEKVVTFDWQKVTIKEFCERLTELVGARVTADEATLQDVGLKPDFQFDARAKNLSLSVALRECLGNRADGNLTVVVEDGILKLTSLEKASLGREQILYNVGSLGVTGDRLDDFVELILSSTSGPWDVDEPGTGTISVHHGRSAIIVRQSSPAQNEILELLRDLRIVPDSEPLFKPAESESQEIGTRYYRVAPQTAAALVKLIPASIAKGSWDVGVPSGIQDATSTSQPLKESDKTQLKPVLGTISIVEVPDRKIGIYFIESPQNEPRLTWVEGGEGLGDGLSQEEKGFCYLAITHRRDVHASVVRLLQALHRIPVDGWDYIGQHPAANFQIQSHE